MGPLPSEMLSPPPSRLLWVTDLEDIEAALGLAIEYAGRLKAQLKLFHALPDRADAIQSRVAAELLDRAASTARAAGVECDWNVGSAPLAVSLQDISETWSPDRILRMRRDDLSYEGLDPATETILREALVPVFIIDREHIPDCFHSPPRILFPSTLDRNSLDVAGAVLRFARVYGAEITMLHVIDGETRRTSWIERVKACATTRFRELLEDLGGMHAETLTELGNVPDTVVRIAQTHQHNLILLSVVSGISFRNDIRPGSAYKILCNAPCPVLVCKPNVLPSTYGAEKAHQALPGPLHLPLA